MYRTHRSYTNMVDIMRGSGSPERLAGVLAFTRTFVPDDVTEDDVVFFSTNLAEDEVYHRL